MNKWVLVAIGIAAIAVVLLFLMPTITKALTPSPTPTPTTSTPTPSPGSTPGSTSSGTITVNQFLITNGCTGSYCWAEIQFTPSSSLVGATLQKVTVNYSNGSSYSFCGSIPISSGTNTVWLNDFLPCNHLGCNAPTITSLTFVTSAGSVTVNVTPTATTFTLGNNYLVGGC